MISRPFTLLLAITFALAGCSRQQDRLDEADRLLRTADMRYDEGRYEDAVRYASQAFDEFAKQLGSDAADTIRCRGDLAEFMRAAGQTKNAVAVSRTQLAICIRVHGERGPETQQARVRLANCLKGADASAEAEQLVRKAVEESDQDFGPDSPVSMFARQGLMVMLIENRKFDEAVRQGIILLETQQQKFSDKADQVLSTRANLASAYMSQGLLDSAEKEFRKVLQTRTQRQGADHPDTLHVQTWLGTCLRDQKRVEDALPILRDVWERSNKILGTGHPRSIASGFDLAAIEAMRGNKSEALRLLLSTLELAEKHLGPQHSTTLLLQEAVSRMQ